jgi:hypothetical protein
LFVHDFSINEEKKAKNENKTNKQTFCHIKQKYWKELLYVRGVFLS